MRFSHPTRITNPWLPLSIRRCSELRGVDDGKLARSVRRLLPITHSFTINGQRVQAAIVEDRSYEAGKLHEVALDHYAQADDGTVYYLGEDVNYYQHGQVVSHEGAFRYGRETKALGVAMPARPVPGQRFAIENIPGQGSESNLVKRTVSRVGVPAGDYSHAIQIDGWVLPDREREVKLYARGVGLLQERSPAANKQLVGCS
ncbi:MAG: hypothetical protein ACJ76S_13790 [Solirubrobacteraceae bacterium]